MFQITDLVDMQALAESAELEFKLAQGKEGDGKLPNDFWPTYSAMANTRGGYVVLGVREKSGNFTVAGISNAERIKQDLFNNLNNPQQVSLNLLSDRDIDIVTLEDKQILVIHIPAASRQQKPIYLKNQPMKETYLRLHDGDRVCSKEQVKRMLAEQVEDSRDDKLLVGFDLNDIDQDSLHAYKQLLAVAKPQHPWLELGTLDFMRSIGGWKKDRQTGTEGMTLAGVLMFGSWQAIQDAAPHYFVDYQERPEAKAETRWIDRICPDGTWSGNVFDFYRRTYRKLTTELKVPFEIKDGVRQDDTLIHVALREALVNTLVHADYTGRVSILVVKGPDMFGFRNPGLMRIAPDAAIRGGETDCRNRRMHQMFLMIGIGERAGSGIPKIYSGWQSANWRVPKLYEKAEPEQTLLELSTASLIPEAVYKLLQRKFGDAVNLLDDFEKMIVTTAAMEGWINHQRACQLTTKHSRDVTLALPRLENKGFLVSSGERRDKSYSLPGMEPFSPEELFPNALSSLGDLTHSDSNLTHSDFNLTHSDSNLTHTEARSSGNNQERDIYGRLVSRQLDKPFVDDLVHLQLEFRQKLEEVTKPAMESRRLPPEAMQEIIKALCADHYVAIGVLSLLMDRTAQSIRQNYLKPMLGKELKMAFPNKPNTPKQGYTII